mgnify:FL=1
MFLGEPPRSQADLHFSLFGIPVRVHPLFWFVALFLNYRNLRAPMDVVTWIAAVFVAVLVHEFGHALTMQTYGLHPWITLYGLGGLTSYDTRLVSQSRGSGSLAQVLISFAGPAAGFLVAGVIVLIAYASGHRVAIWNLVPVIDLQNPRLALLVYYFLFISILWGLINLLPVYPLDGGQIAREIFVAITPRNGIRLSLILSVLTAAGMAIYALAAWHSILVAIMFGYLAYGSYQTLLAYSSRTPWQ